MFPPLSIGSCLDIFDLGHTFIIVSGSSVAAFVPKKEEHLMQPCPEQLPGMERRKLN